MTTGKLSDPTPVVEQNNYASAAAYEAETVHAVYDAIAPHFSATRYKPWPLIPLFLSSFPPGSVGADLGCGNGKYLPIYSALAPRDAWVPAPHPKKRPPPPKRKSKPDPETGPVERRALLPPGTIVTVGADMSKPLVEHASLNTGHLLEESCSFRNEVTVGDALLPSFRPQIFDYALSIATIHHFSTRERRLAAIHELIRLIRPVTATPDFSQPEPTPVNTADEEEAARILARDNMGCGPGRFMVYAWAMEQRGGRRAAFEAVPSEDGVPSNKPQQDFLVPWVLAKEHQTRPGPALAETKVYQRCESDLMQTSVLSG